MRKQVLTSLFNTGRATSRPDRRRPIKRGGTRPLLGVLVLACAAGATACGSPSPTTSPAAEGRPAVMAPSQSLSPPAAARSTTPLPSGPVKQGGTASASAGASSPNSNRTPAAVHVSVAPTHLPAYTVESWTANAAGPVRDVSGHDIQLNECATIHGASTWQQQPYESSGGDSAILEAYTFPTAAQAGSAFTAALSGMQACQATSRALQATNHTRVDAVTRETAGAAEGAAFERTWTGVEGISAAGPQTNHLYLAVSGNAVVILHFDELAQGGSASAYDIRNDSSVLTMLKGALADRVD